MRISRLIVLALTAVMAAACTGVEMVPLPPPSPVPSETPVTAPAAPSPVATLEATEPMSPTPGSQKPTFQTRPQDLFKPQPGDEGMVRGPAFVDEAQVVSRESLPPQISLNLAGNLPTPCNKLRVQVAPPDQENQIRVSVYSVAPKKGFCTQVLEPFETSVPLEGYPKGKYSVLVNEQPAGEFEIP